MAAGEATLNSVATDTQQAPLHAAAEQLQRDRQRQQRLHRHVGLQPCDRPGHARGQSAGARPDCLPGARDDVRAAPAVGPLQSTTFVDPTAVSSDPTVVFSVLDAMVAGSASVRTGTKQLTVPRASSAQHLATGLLSPELTVLDSVIENWTPVRGSAVEPHAATSTVSSDSGSTMKLNILPAIRSGQPGLVIDLGILEVPGSGTAIGSRLRKSLFF